MILPASRSVTALVTYAGEDLGVVGPFGVDSPWWADVEPVVAHLREVIGVNVVVLRLVDVDGGTSPRDGHVTYHAETLSRPTRPLPSAAPLASAAVHPPMAPHDALVAPTPGRAAWATAAGVRAALQWAGAHLPPADPVRADSTDSTGTLRKPVEMVVEQVKTWNLSGLFRIPTASGPVWLKLTPPFAAYEPAVTKLIAAVDPEFVPAVIALDPENRRVLMEDVPGEDCWDASPELIRATMTRWIAAQAAIAKRPTPPESVVPDRRPKHLIDGLDRLLDGEAGAQLTSDEMASARKLQEKLPGMISELDACGLPYTLIHGDFHPGNWRSDGERTVLVDFADAYIGHPAFDGERLRGFVGPEREQPVIDAWCDAWTVQAPGSDPRRALELARPLQAVAGAIVYQMFLDNIETSERPYHELDPPAGIRAAISAV